MYLDTLNDTKLQNEYANIKSIRPKQLSEK